MRSGFKGWLRAQRKRDDATGDIARDALRDSCWDARKDPLWFHIEHDHDGSTAAVEAARAAEHEYLLDRPA